MDKHEDKAAATPAGDEKRKSQQEKKSARLRQQQHDRERSDRGGPQGQKDKDFQRKF